jgi:uncharacterized protein (DUF3820 family)
VEPKLEDLIKIANMKMPFGRYRGWTLIDLPEPYVVWFYKEGFPPGEIGNLLAQLYEIKCNSLEYLFEPLRHTSGNQDFESKRDKLEKF